MGAFVSTMIGLNLLFSESVVVLLFPTRQTNDQRSHDRAQQRKAQQHKQPGGEQAQPEEVQLVFQVLDLCH